MFDIKRLDDSKVYLVDDFGAKLTGRDCKVWNDKFEDAVDHRGLLVILADNSASSVLTYVLCLANKVPVMLLESNIDQVRLDELLEIYAPKFLAGRHIDGDFSLLDFGIKSLQQGSEEAVEVNPDLALLLSTSGSTGSRKFVRISRQALLANTASILDYLPIQPEDVAIKTLPMSYTYGLSVINTHFAAGAKIVATNLSVLQREFWNLVSDECVTSLAGVPYSWEIMIKSGFLKRSLPDLKYITQAGGNLGRSYKERLQDYCTQNGIELYVMYGQTEATSRMSFVPPDRLSEKLDSIGIPVRGGRFELDVDYPGLNHAFQHSHPGKTIGEIVYFGENVSMGYARSREDLCLGDENGGQLFTGDLGYVDQDGYWYVVGRKKRFAKVFGVRISLEEIEVIVRELTGLDEVLAVELDGKIHIRCVGEIQDKELHKQLSQSAKIHPSAFKAVQVEEIPRNESGKVIYK